jgi:RND family efflux transporter MFP subunit
MRANLSRSYHVTLAGCVLTSLIVGCSRPPVPEESPPLAPVTAENARLLTLAEWTDVLGTTQPLPNHVARITAAIEGRVLPFNEAVVEGQEVKADDPVVRLDVRLVEERRRQAETAVRLAQLDVDRLDALARTPSGTTMLVSPIERDKARLALEDAQSKRKAVEEELKLYTLRAPIAGRLGLLQVVAGQTIPAGTTVADVVDLNDIDLLCFVPPHVASRLALDQQARLVRIKADGKTEALPPIGKVVFLAVQAQPDTGNFAVKIRVPNQDQALRANSVVRAQVQTKPEEGRLTIPMTALMEDTDPPTVVVVQDLKTVLTKEKKDEEQGVARKYRARIGARFPNEEKGLVEILGLENEKKESVPPESVLFIVKGANGLQDGDKVKLEKDEDD